MSGPKVILHVGAHKTATTYLQARLAKSVNPLRQMQVGYVDLQQFREAQALAGGLRRAEPRYALLRHRALRRELSRLIERQIYFGATRVVLSDENILGNLGELFGDHDFYPRAGARVRVLVDALSNWDVEIAVSTRCYASFLVSVWSHIVMRDGFRPFDPRCAGALLGGDRGWVDVLSDIRRAVPNAKICHWAYEDLAGNEHDVLQALIGEVAPSAVEPITWQALMGLSAPAVEQIADLYNKGDSALSAERIRAVARHFSKAQGYRRYDPWPSNIEFRLTGRYRDDLRRIGEMTGVDRIGVRSVRQAA